jgi:hypothetical protein
LHWLHNWLSNWLPNWLLNWLSNWLGFSLRTAKIKFTASSQTAGDEKCKIIGADLFSFA